MGLSSKKTKTTSQEQATNTSTTTPNVPGYISSAYEGLAGQIGGLQNGGVAGVSSLQQQGFDQASQGAGVWQPYIQQAAQAAGAVNANPNLIGQTNLATATGYAPSTYSASTYDPTGYQSEKTTAATIAPTANVSASSLLEGLQNYYNPYDEQVIQTSANDFDVNADRTRASQALQASRSGAFGGSRYGVREAETEGELSRGRSSLLSGLRQAGFNTATSLSGQDADRRQSASNVNAAAENARAMAQAQLQQQVSLDNASRGDASRSFFAGAQNTAGQFNAGSLNTANQFGANAFNEAGQFGAGALNDASRFNAGALNDTARLNQSAQESADTRGLNIAGLYRDLGSTAGALNSQDVQNLVQTGGIQRAIEQAQRDGDYTRLTQLSTLLSGLPIDALTGRTTTGSSTGNKKSTTTELSLADLAKVAQAGAAIAGSDARLKEQIETVGFDDKGRRWVDFNYIGDDTRHLGVIAQEVITSDPNAVSVRKDGYLQVDYSQINGDRFQATMSGGL